MQNVTALAEEVRTALLTAIDKDELQLPTLPEVAMQVRATAEDPNVDTVKLAAVIGDDLALTARILKMANSPLMRAAHQIDDLKTAVSRLGIPFTANLAVGLAMQQMFQATNPVTDRQLRSIWSHAAQVASIASVLTRQYTTLKTDRALLAGLVHSIGALPILSYAEEHDDRLQNGIVLQQVIDRIHGELGAHILTVWDFPDDITSIPLEYCNFEREVAEVDYVDIVMVANLQAHLGTDHPLAQVDWDQVSAFERLGLEPDVEDTEVIDLSAETLEALEAA